MKRTLVALCCVLLAVAARAETIRINPAERETVILIPAERNFGVYYAAEELAYHIEKMTGCKLRTVKEPEPIPEGAFVFSLGETEFANGFGISGKDLYHNHAMFLGDGDKMIIAGKDKGQFMVALLIDTSATLFALYDILENDNGCHWLWPGELGESFPKTDCFQFEAGSREMVPKLRFFFWRQYWNTWAQWPSDQSYAKFMDAEMIWLLRHRSNRDMSEQNYPHAFESWPAKYLETHPEFFNLLPDGTRRPSPLEWGGMPKLVSMCVGSEAFRRQVVHDWLESYNPNEPRINLKSNDSALQCVCDDCMRDDHSPIPVEERRARAKARYDKGDSAWHRELGSVTNRQIEFYLAVMREADRVAPEKHARFSGLIYANFSDAPEAGVHLGPRFQLCYCPPMLFPWTEAKVKKYKDDWDGWYKTGCDLVIRPNYTLDGHCYPISYAREFHDVFTFAEPRALKGSDYDSLTGMYGAQALTLYTIARLQNSRPGLPFETIEKEFYSVFGDAEPAVREYFGRLAEISRDAAEPAFSNRPEGGDLSTFYLAGHHLFTRERFAELGAILERAAAAVPADSIERARVKFLQIGLEHARLTAETAAAFEDYTANGNYLDFAEKINALDDFRAANAGSFAYNVAACRMWENGKWARGLVKQMTKDTVPLPIDWPFRIDPDKTGEQKGWASAEFDESAWERIPTDRAWELSGYDEYDGYGWYRVRITLPEDMPGQPVLMVGSADEACEVWVNGRHILHRPFPFEGNQSSWNEPFEVPFGDAAHPGENVIAIRVEDNVGQGGLTKRCFLKFVPKEDAK